MFKKDIISAEEENEFHQEINNALSQIDSNKTLAEKNQFIPTVKITQYNVPLFIAMVYKFSYMTAKEWLRGLDYDNNCFDHKKRTALHFSIARGDFESSKKLIDDGADLFVKDRNSLSPVDYIFEYINVHKSILGKKVLNLIDLHIKETVINENKLVFRNFNFEMLLEEFNLLEDDLKHRYLNMPFLIYFYLVKGFSSTCHLLENNSEKIENIEELLKEVDKYDRNIFHYLGIHGELERSKYSFFDKYTSDSRDNFLLTPSDYQEVKLTNSEDGAGLKVQGNETSIKSYLKTDEKQNFEDSIVKKTDLINNLESSNQACGYSETESKNNVFNDSVEIISSHHKTPKNEICVLIDLENKINSLSSKIDLILTILDKYNFHKH